jgi:hypothetical protein
MTKFNEFQKAAIRAYPNDEAKYLLEDDEVDTQNVDVGDSLLAFIIRELDDADMDINTAIQRMETVRADVEAVLHALTKGSPPGGWRHPHRRGPPPLTLAFSRKNSDSDGKD